MDSNPTRARRKAAQYAAQSETLRALARAQRKVDAAQRKVEAAERKRDAALLAARSAGVRSPRLRAVLGGASRATVFRRVKAAQEAVA